MSKISADVLALIGRTPLVALGRIHPGPGKIVAKAEFVQPGGSVKDRAALRIIQDARNAGRLMPGQLVVEMTSGNMGAGLAVVCNVYGNPFIATLSEGNSPARAKMLEVLGAEVVLVPQVDGSPGKVTGKDIGAAIARAEELVRDRGAYYVDQFNNPSCVAAHEDGTGPEIEEAVGDELDAFVACVGTGGTFIGTSRYLKRRRPSIHCCAVEPLGAEVLACMEVTKPDHLLQGTGYSIVPPQWQPELVDGFLSVSDEEATEFQKKLAETEGLFVGYSAAANVCAACKLAESGQLGPDPIIATILCDTGLKYV
jgi:cysteine synthase A